MSEVSKLCERMTWVIRIGSVLIALLIGGYGYQATVNNAIAATQAKIELHIQDANNIHRILINNWAKE